MNHNGLSPALCTLVIHSQFSAPSMVSTTHWSGFHHRFDKAITAPAESKQNSHRADKFFYVPKHGVLICKKGVDKELRSKRVQGMCVAGREATRSLALWKRLCIAPLLRSPVAGRLVLTYSSAASQHYIAHNTVSPSSRTEIFSSEHCSHPQTASTDAALYPDPSHACCCQIHCSAVGDQGQLLTWAFAFSISPCSLWIIRFISEISFFVLRRSSPCFPAVTCSASYCDIKQHRTKGWSQAGSQLAG